MVATLHGKHSGRVHHHSFITTVVVECVVLCVCVCWGVLTLSHVHSRALSRTLYHMLAHACTGVNTRTRTRTFVHTRERNTLGHTYMRIRAHSDTLSFLRVHRGRSTEVLMETYSTSTHFFLLKGVVRKEVSDESTTPYFFTIKQWGLL
jgi:hypothetical protein